MKIKFVFINGSERVLYLEDKNSFKEFSDKAVEFKFISFRDITIQMEHVMYFEMVQ